MMFGWPYKAYATSFIDAPPLGIFGIEASKINEDYVYASSSVGYQMAVMITNLHGTYNEGWTVYRAALGGTDRQGRYFTSSGKEDRNSYEPDRRGRPGGNFDTVGLHI